MKISKLFVGAISCFTIAAGLAVLSCAENATPISTAGANSSNAVYVDGSLETPLSPGIRVIAYSQPMIISGINGEDIQFSAEVFNDHSGYVPSSIRILSLPSEDSGTLTYKSIPVSIGQSVSVLSLSSLHYSPNSSEDAEFTFSPDGATVIRCIVKQKDSENHVPESTNDTAVTTFTKMDAHVAGYLSGSDPDGDTVSFEIVSHPVKGIVSVSDSRNGQFIYHPYEGITGNDSFTYRICDSYGAYSDTYTVDVHIEASKATAYFDTVDSNYASAIHDVVASGVMQMRKTADSEYFDPHEPVSKIDFLIMAMKTAGSSAADPVEVTAFADDDTMTDEEKGYLSAAYRLGIIKGATIDGKLCFMPDEAVTGATAAVMLNSILGLPENSSISASAMSDSVPTWAVPSVSALTSAGIINKYIAPANSVLTRENVAVILSQLMKELA